MNLPINTPTFLTRYLGNYILNNIEEKKHIKIAYKIFKISRSYIGWQEITVLSTRWQALSKNIGIDYKCLNVHLAITTNYFFCF